jgi:predicted AlkP superfamily pyrophosphatase or phosphodiesterase
LNRDMIRVKRLLMLLLLMTSVAVAAEPPQKPKLVVAIVVDQFRYDLLEPFWIFGARGATHGTPFNYDSHVPILFMGPGIRAGVIDDDVAVNDIAPTLATLLEIELPNGADGRVLKEILVRDSR